MTTDTPIPTPRSNLFRLKMISLAILAVVLILDLWSKAYMEELLGMDPDAQGPASKPPIVVFDWGWTGLSWEGTYNPGVTFGLAQHQTSLILTLTIIATLGLLIWFLGTRSKSRLLHWGLGMIIAGALGNLYDRVSWHKVRDFILNWADFGGGQMKWPNYNVADMGIVIGVGFIVWDSLFGIGAKEAAERADQRKAEKAAKAEREAIEEDRRRAGS